MGTIIYQGREVTADKVDEIGGYMGSLLGQERNGVDQLWRDEAGRYYLHRQRYATGEGLPEYTHEAKAAGTLWERTHAINVNAAILWALTPRDSGLRAAAAGLLMEGRGYTDPHPSHLSAEQRALLRKAVQKPVALPTEVPQVLEEERLTRLAFDYAPTRESGGGCLEIVVSDEQMAQAEKLAVHFGVGARQFLALLALGDLPGQPQKDDTMTGLLFTEHVTFACSDRKLLRRIRRAAKASGLSVEGFVASAVAGYVDTCEEDMIVHPRTGRLLCANDDDLYTRERHRLTSAPIGQEHERKWQRTLHRQHVQFSAHLTTEQMERLEYPHLVHDCATDRELPCVLIPYDAEEGLPYLTVNGRDVAPWADVAGSTDARSKAKGAA
ncbi:MAG: hypothetical protein INR62_02020 [Rhodospirillales bacterium]|nr:hypothetical protein [Acetobacter sp.]